MTTQQKRQRAEPATPEPYLWYKPQARDIWFRYSVPVRYRAVEQRKIIQRSTGTRSRPEASLLAAKWRIELHQQWDSLLYPDGAPQKLPVERPLTDPSIFDLQVAATEAAYIEMQAKLDVLRRSKDLKSNEALTRYTASLSDHLMRLVRTRDGEARHLWQRVGDRLITQNNWRLAKGTSRYADFLDMISEAGIEALRIDIERNKGNLGAQSTSAIVTTGLVAAERAASPGETILALFDTYAAQRGAEKRKRADTLKQDRKVLELLAEFIGTSRSLRSVSRLEIREWRDMLALLPPTFRKHKAYEGLSIRDAAAKARTLHAKPMQLVTVNKYLSTVSPLFDWACRNGYADTNPCQKLHFDIPKNQNPRPPFSTDQLNALVKSPLFTGFESHGKEYKPGSRRADDWRYPRRGCLC